MRVTCRKKGQERGAHQSRADLPCKAAVLPDLILDLSPPLLASSKVSLNVVSPVLLRPLLLELPDGLPIRLCESEPGTVIFEGCLTVTFACGAGR